MKFALKDVVSNPFRDLQHFPYIQRKLDKLEASIRETGWWENIVGRIVSGKFQIAHGHHRVEALRRVDPTGTHEFIVKELTDDKMFQMMALENDTDYGSDLYMVIENVRAAVFAFADGKIKLNPVPKDTPEHGVRVAPSFIAGIGRSEESSGRVYTTLTVAHKLCATQAKGKEPADKIRAAVLALECIDLKLWKWSDLKAFEDKHTGALMTDAVLNAARDTKKRAEHSLAKARLQVAAASESAKQAQAQLEAQHAIHEAERKKAAEDLQNLADLAEADTQKEMKRRHDEYLEKQAKEKATEKERKRQKKELDDKVAAAKAEQAAAEKKAAQAATAQALASKPPKGSVPPKTYFPEMGFIIQYLEGIADSAQFSTALGKLKKDRALLTEAQIASLNKAREQAVKRLTAIKF